MPMICCRFPIHDTQVVAQLKPHTLVFNSGLWRTMGKDPAWPRDVYDRIFEAANAAVAPQVHPQDGGRATAAAMRSWEAHLQPMF